MARECVICLSEEEGDNPLLQMPCSRHHICQEQGSDCLANFFRQAMDEERKYPAHCCNAMLFIEEFGDIVGWDLVYDYERKEQEYSVPPKSRVYCSSLSCDQFLHPNRHETDAGLTFARCDACQTITCASCKAEINLPMKINKCPKQQSDCVNERGQRCQNCAAALLAAVIEHTCEVREEDRKFKLTAKEKGFQECSCCGKTIELAEACNHITCSCGNEFCYICGRTWDRGCTWGCPLYGPAKYDEEGYNEEGFHRDTGLDREGLSALERFRRHRHGEDEDGDAPDDDDEDDDNNPLEAEMAALGIGEEMRDEMRTAFAQMSWDEVQEALDQFRIAAFEEGGVVFDALGRVVHQPDGDNELDDDGEDDEQDDDDNEEEDEAEQEDLGNDDEVSHVIPDFDHENAPEFDNRSDPNEPEDMDIDTDPVPGAWPQTS